MVEGWVFLRYFMEVHQKVDRRVFPRRGLDRKLITFAILLLMPILFPKNTKPLRDMAATLSKLQQYVMADMHNYTYLHFHGPDESAYYFLPPDRHDGFQKGHMGSTSVEKDIAASWYEVNITHSTLSK